MRKNSFVSLIEVNKVYNITYSGTKSFDIIHKLSERSALGEVDRHVIIEYHYSNPLVIDVLVNEKAVDSFPFTARGHLPDHSTTCGANNYFREESNIHFVVTNKPDCQVQVRLLNHVMINARIGMS